MESYTKDIVLVIPAYNPDAHLSSLLNDLLYKWEGPIVVVDDGSEDKSYLRSIQKSNVHLLEHYVNLGKGRSIKNAINYSLITYKDIMGFVLADCDGKFSYKDILKVAYTLSMHPNHLILGARDMNSPNWPSSLRWGNKIFTQVMNFTFDLSIHDSQSGLRGIPKEYAATCLNLPGDRYEFDTNVLLSSKKAKIDIKEVAIETNFLEGDAEDTHFKPFKDTLEIASAIIKFAASSGACSVLDLFLYSFFCTGIFTGKYSILLATVTARIVSSTLNYLINRKMVFDADHTDFKTKEKYFLLVVGIMISSAILVSLLTSIIPLPSLIIKLLVDFLLWFANYYFQRTWVFK
ncbi:MAG: bifunctional glycosyltransferase family 2/GtrA family protein [Bacillota bacterium]|nr:bifunctional glycosyltransferase family 2/GtrA family protein [Bacillota bacterium]